MKVDFEIVAKMIGIDIDTLKETKICPKKIMITKLLQYLEDHPDIKKRVENYIPENAFEKDVQDVILCRCEL